jgi:hypothetical protein
MKTTHKWVPSSLLCIAAASAPVLAADAVSAAPPPNSKTAHKGVVLPNNVLQVDWDELLPPGAPEQADSWPPAPQHNYLGESAPAAKQTGSSAVNPDLHGLTLRIPGFIVPLDFDSAGRVVQFFLVPYYGACIHVPPPPPNQIVYVTAAKPFQVKDGTDAYWITGQMRVERKRTAMASASYSMTATKVEVYP